MKNERHKGFDGGHREQVLRSASAADREGNPSYAMVVSLESKERFRPRAFKRFADEVLAEAGIQYRVELRRFGDRMVHPYLVKNS